MKLRWFPFISRGVTVIADVVTFVRRKLETCYNAQSTMTVILCGQRVTLFELTEYVKIDAAQH